MIELIKNMEHVVMYYKLHKCNLTKGNIDYLFNQIDAIAQNCEIELQEFENAKKTRLRTSEKCLFI